MIKGITVTLPSNALLYNLFALILNALGYAVVPATLIAVPQNQVTLDINFFPNLIRELQLAGDSANGAGTITVSDSRSFQFFPPLSANQSNTIRSMSDNIDLTSIYVKGSVNGVKLNVLGDYI